MLSATGLLSEIGHAYLADIASGRQLFSRVCSDSFVFSCVKGGNPSPRSVRPSPLVPENDRRLPGNFPGAGTIVIFTLLRSRQ
jgi:hypothetical protein